MDARPELAAATEPLLKARERLIADLDGRLDRQAVQTSNNLAH